MNGGGIRTDSVYPPGTTITRRNVLAALPFGNRLVPIEITGRALRQGLENGLSRLPQSSGRFPQVSGITLTADASRPPGSRILSLQVDGAPVDPDRVYRVAINDYLARGGDGYETFRTAKHLLPVEDAPPLNDEVMTYLQALGTVRAVTQGRIVLK
jgi:2',3'-cyclic-nucleotide 2'-phosphodiesterase (5'-nucleotidase family)